MALRRELTERHRAAIQADALIKRLTGCALGEYRMSSTQVNAALGLLRKAIPDLKAVEMDLQGDVKGAILISTSGVEPADSVKSEDETS